MDVAIVIALIALAGSIFSTVLTVVGAPVLQSRREANVVLETYRKPLVAAAYELQSRLYNILHNQFLDIYLVWGKSGKEQAALGTTLYVFAQFFGWREIIRREIQVLRFQGDEETREVSRLLNEIEGVFYTDAFGPQFMIWRIEQRGFGERMILTSDGKPTCMGYATFLDSKSTMKGWLDPLETDLRQLDERGRNRLTKLQALLEELVRVLDPNALSRPTAYKRDKRTAGAGR